MPLYASQKKRHECAVIYPLMEQKTSPRKAIFQWLAQAGQDTAENAVQPDVPNLASSQKLLDFTNKDINSTQPRVANKLKLHTIFPNIEEDSYRTQCQQRGHKRKRHSPSQPPAGRCIQKGMRTKPDDGPRSSIRSLSPNTGESECNVGREDGRQLFEDISATTGPYERRQRHKTRDDHYVLKDGNNGTKSEIKGRKPEAKERKRQKHREKTGSALLHRFNAPNIAPERLTVSISTCHNFQCWVDSS